MLIYKAKMSFALMLCFIAVLGLPASGYCAKASLEIAVVSNDTIDIHLVIDNILTPETERYILIRNSDHPSEWTWYTNGDRYLRDGGLTYNASYTYRLQFQKFQGGQWQNIGQPIEDSGVAGEISGDFLADNLTWHTDEILRVFHLLRIPPGLTLTIEPNCYVRFMEYDSRIQVEGTMNTMGTSMSPVYLSAASPQNDWSGIHFKGNGTGNFAYTQVSDGGKFSVTGYRCITVEEAARINLDHCDFIRCKGAVYFDSSETSSVNNCSFSDGHDYPMQINAAGRFPALFNNTAQRNATSNRVKVIFGNVTHDSTIMGNLGFEVPGFDISDGATLQIDPGVTIYFEQGPSRIDVRGNLVVGQAKAGKVRFFPLRPDEGWGAFTAYENGTMEFYNCIFEKGGRFHERENTTISYKDSSGGVVQDCQFTYCFGTIRVQTNSTTEITGNRFLHGGEQPILVNSRNVFPQCMNNYAVGHSRFDGIYIQGPEIERNNSLANSALPYLFGQVSLQEGKTLTIWGGNNIFFDQESDAMIVNGNLRVNGNTDYNVTFRGNNVYKRFGGISVKGNGSAIIYYTQFYGGGFNSEHGGAALSVHDSAMAQLTDCNFTACGVEAAVAAFGSGRLQLDNCNIINNPNNGITAASSSPVVIRGGVIKGCTRGINLNGTDLDADGLSLYDNQYGLYSQTTGDSVVLNNGNVSGNSEYGVFNQGQERKQPAIINAEHNYWGDPSGPYHESTNPDGLGDKVSDYVDYEPWTNLPPTPTPTPLPTFTPTATWTQQGPPTFTPTVTPTFTPSPSPTIDPGGRPVILLAGYWNSDLQAGKPSLLRFMALLSDQGGCESVEMVEVYYGGFSLGIELYDDGFHDDFERGDCIFGWDYLFGDKDLQPSYFLLGLMATDVDDNRSFMWPYLDVR